MLTGIIENSKKQIPNSKKLCMNWNLSRSLTGMIFGIYPLGFVSKFERKSRLSKRHYKENVTIFL